MKTPAILLPVAFLALTLTAAAQGPAPKPLPKPSQGKGIRLELLFDDKGAPWTMTRKDFSNTFQRAGFSWMSSDQRMAKAYRQPNAFLGTGIWELIATFGTNTLEELTAVIFNRGDAGDPSKSEFSKMLSETKNSLNEWSGSEGARDQKDLLNAGGIRQESMTWRKPPHRASLVWGYTTKDTRGKPIFRAEFLRIVFSRFDARAAVLNRTQSRNSSAGKKVSQRDLVSRVSRNASGDTVIDGVPMVDQGPKGYCVAATVERVMRYFGFEVDQHDIAQAVATSALSGTNPEVMTENLKKLGAQLGSKIITINEMEYRDFVRMIESYNREARKEGRSPLPVEQIINLSSYYAAMDTALLKEARKDDKGPRNRFEKEIYGHVDAGMPLAWAVMLGKIKEDPELPEQAQGGHMRLIIGYNKKADELLYTDSWGEGHELKRMAMDDAWAITLGAYGIEPRWTTR